MDVLRQTSVMLFKNRKADENNKLTTEGRNQKDASEKEGKHFFNTDPPKFSRNSSGLKTDVLVSLFIIYSSMVDKQL